MQIEITKLEENGSTHKVTENTQMCHSPQRRHANIVHKTDMWIGVEPMKAARMNACQKKQQAGQMHKAVSNLPVKRLVGLVPLHECQLLLLLW